MGLDEKENPEIAFMAKSEPKQIKKANNKKEEPLIYDTNDMATWEAEAENLAWKICEASNDMPQDQTAKKNIFNWKQRLAYLLFNETVRLRSLRGKEGARDISGEIFTKAFEYSLSVFQKGNFDTYVSCFRWAYKLKARGEKADTLNEKNGVDSELKERAVKEALLMIASKKGMSHNDAAEKIKAFNVLKKARCDEFLRELGCTEDEIETFHKNVYNYRYTESFQNTIKSEDGQSEISLAEIEISKQGGYYMTSAIADAINLDIVEEAYDIVLHKSKARALFFKQFMSISMLMMTTEDASIMIDEIEPYMDMDFYKRHRADNDIGEFKRETARRSPKANEGDHYVDTYKGYDYESFRRDRLTACLEKETGKAHDTVRKAFSFIQKVFLHVAGEKSMLRRQFK